MFELIGILAVIMIIGAIVFVVGYKLFDGALSLIMAIVVIAILFFALKGCAMG